ncbi:hypothetical protein C5S53_12245 [Methanophagales archaeon]|nr:hypothetical protein C5S53_12245 [Methanophagales archaeon]
MAAPLTKKEIPKKNMKNAIMSIVNLYLRPTKKFLPRAKEKETKEYQAKSERKCPRVTKIIPVRASHSNPVNKIGYPIAIHQGIKEGLKVVRRKPPKI